MTAGGVSAPPLPLGVIMQIAYVPHPVSPDRKRELRAAGFKILDARFAPKGMADALQEQEETEVAPEAVTVKRRGRPPKREI